AGWIAHYQVILDTLDAAVKFARSYGLEICRAWSQNGSESSSRWFTLKPLCRYFSSMPAPLWPQPPQPFSLSDPRPARYHYPSLLRHGKCGDVAAQSTRPPNISVLVAVQPAVSPATLSYSRLLPPHWA